MPGNRDPSAVAEQLEEARTMVLQGQYDAARRLLDDVPEAQNWIPLSNNTDKAARDKAADQLVKRAAQYRKRAGTYERDASHQVKAPNTSENLQEITDNRGAIDPQAYEKLRRAMVDKNYGE